jgi:predicted ester cyclase
MEDGKKLPRLPNRMPIEYRERTKAQNEADQERREELVEHVNARFGADREHVRAFADSAPPEHGMPWFFRDAIAEYEFSMSGQKVSKDNMVSRWTVRGRHDAPLCGVPATQKDLRIDGITVTTLDDWQVVEEWTYWDLPGLMEQIGATPPAAAGDAPGAHA